MYERFYQLRERPFALTPDPEYLYLGRVHREALGYLRLGIESNAGFVVITGEIGSGKTTLLQSLLRSLGNRAAVARLVNTLLEPKELLEAILIDFGVDPVPASKPAMVRELARVLVDQRTQGQRVLVVIDEAQNLSRGALEELRMLSNLETEKSKLVQVLLVGQPDLRDRLAAPAMEQLRQRITVRHHIEPLDALDTYNYINHRLRHAAIGTPLTFSREGTDAIHARSRGIPRMINVICDAVLLFGYGEERRRIGPSLLATVFEELESNGVLTRPWAKAPIATPWGGATEAPAASPPTATPSTGPQSEEHDPSPNSRRPVRERVLRAMAPEPSSRVVPALDPRRADRDGHRPLEAPTEQAAESTGCETSAVSRPEDPRVRSMWGRTRRLLFTPPVSALKDG